IQYVYERIILFSFTFNVAVVSGCKSTTYFLPGKNFENFFEFIFPNSFFSKTDLICFPVSFKTGRQR
ncbi:MAG: hypothetical protein ACO1N9_05470, partial [Flavobacterium sp.]